MPLQTTAPLPDRIRSLDPERRRRYAQNLAFYQGAQWTGQRWTERERGRRRLTINYTRAMIDKLTSYLMGAGRPCSFAVPLDGDDQERARASERALVAVHEDNALAQLDFDTEIDCAVLGDAAYRVVWDAANERVSVTAPDVSGIFAWTEANDFNHLSRVVHQYEATETDASRQKKRLITEDWTTHGYTKWANSEVVTSGANPYGFIPYVIYPNIRRPKSFWGESDVEQLREAQVELNRAMTQLSRILEVSGNPIAAFEGVEKNNKGEEFKVEPGTVWLLPPDTRAYLIDLLAGNGVRLHIEYLDKIYRALHDLAEMPRTAFGDNSGGVTSGSALQIELDPLIKKVQRKRLIRAAAYSRRSEQILRLLTQFSGVDHSPYRAELVWPSILPSDRRQLVDDERELVASGLHSRRRAANELGVEDPDAEFNRWLVEERQVAALAAPGKEAPTPKPPA